jgi:hypothetical protein
MPAVFNIDPKFQTSVVSLRTFTVLETPVKTHSAYTEPEPLVLSIRDTIADGAPARYLASSAITLGDKLGDGEFKWSASNSPFQINLETHPNLVVDTTEHPTAGSVPYWNGDRHTSTASAYPGLPAGLDAAVIHPEYPTVLMGFKGDVIYYQSITSQTEHTTNGSIAATFPEVTGTPQYAFRTAQKGVNGDGHTIHWQIWIYNSNMDYFNYEYGGGAIDNYTFLGTGNHSWKDYTASGESWMLNFKEEGGVQKVDAAGNTGNFQPYGPGTSLYPTLPNTSPVTAVVNDLVNSRILAFIGGTMYSLTGSPSNSVTEHWVYG